MSIYEDVKQALQDIVAPELQAIRGEVKRLDEKIDLTRSELLARIDVVRQELLATRSELLARIDAVRQELLAKVDAVYHELLAKTDLVAEKVESNQREIQFLRQEMERIRDELVARIEAQEDRMRMVAVHIGDVVAMRERMAAVEAAIKYLPKLPPSEGGVGQLPSGK
jgi:chromosome segregation ATPase